MSIAISRKGKSVNPNAQENAMSFFFMQPTPTMILAIQTLSYSVLCPTCHGKYDYRHRMRQQQINQERLKHQLLLAIRS